MGKIFGFTLFLVFLYGWGNYQSEPDNWIFLIGVAFFLLVCTAIVIPSYFKERHPEFDNLPPPNIGNVGNSVWGVTNQEGHFGDVKDNLEKTKLKCPKH